MVTAGNDSEVEAEEVVVEAMVVEVGGVVVDAVVAGRVVTTGGGEVVAASPLGEQAATNSSQIATRAFIESPW